ERDLANFCDQKSPSVTDLPIDRIGQAVQPTPTQRAALDDLKDASVKAAESLKVSCPAYQMLTPTGRVEAMEKRLDATLGAVKTVQPPLAKFYNSLSDEQKARFNSLRSASRSAGGLHVGPAIDHPAGSRSASRLTLRSAAARVPRAATRLPRWNRAA